MSYAIQYAERNLEERRKRVVKQKHQCERVVTEWYAEGVYVTTDKRWAIVCEDDPDPQPSPTEPAWDPIWYVVPYMLRYDSTLADAVMETDTFRAAKAWIGMQDRKSFMLQTQKAAVVRARQRDAVTA
jgi:hypothetical protein